MKRFSGHFSQVARFTLVLVLGILFSVALNSAVHAAPAADGVTFTVTSTADDADANVGDGVCATANNECTLRAALQEANHTIETDTIDFSIPGNAVPHIVPGTNLPPAVHPVVIDGTTQPTTARVNLDGIDLPVFCFFIDTDCIPAVGLELYGGSTVKGLAIYNFSEENLFLNGGGSNHITNNIFGADAAFTPATNLGPVVFSSSSDNVVGGANVADRNYFFDLLVTRAPNGGGDTFQGNYFGVKPDGTLLDAGFVAELDLGTNQNQIGGTGAGEGNVIAGGLGLEGSNNTVQGNLLGTDASGIHSANAQGTGIEVAGSDNVIGGADPAARNIIAGFALEGIYIHAKLHEHADRNQIENNFIGLGADGTTALGNGFEGIYLAGTDDQGTLDANEIINNVIVNNGFADSEDGFSRSLKTRAGILVAENNSTRTVIQANFIGTTSDDVSGMGNADDGVAVEHGSTNTLIGGTETKDRNIIADNGGYGVELFDSNHTTVRNNFIGVTADDTAAGNEIFGIAISVANDNSILNNRIENSVNNGIHIETGSTGNTVQGNTIAYTRMTSNGFYGDGVYFSYASGNLIGGTDAGQGNDIHDNAGAGIVMYNGLYGFSNLDAVEGNSIYNNGGLGLDWFSDGQPQHNFPYQADGPNHFQPAPVLNSATLNDNGAEMLGTMDYSKTDTNYRVEFFSNDSCDGSGYGEGKTFLGAASMTTDGQGHADLDAQMAGSMTTAQFVTAIATTPDGDSSEFSNCIPFTQPAAGNADLGVSMTGCDYQVQYHCSTVETDHDILYSIRVTNGGPDTPQNVVMTDTLPADTTFVSVTSSQGSCDFADSAVTCHLGRVDFSSGGYGGYGGGSSGASITLILHVTAAADTSITNIATVTSEVGDSNTNNNTAQTDHYVTAPETPTPTPTPFVPDPPAYLDGTTNIIQNGGFEAGASNNPSQPVPGWFGAGASQVVAQDSECGKASGGDGGFLAAGGPHVGSAAQTSYIQEMDVSDASYFIDGENIKYNFEFWAGGKKAFPATVRVTLYFERTRFVDGEITHYTFDPIYPDTNHDGLMHRQLTSVIPHGTRYIDVDVEFRYESFTPFDYIRVCADAFSMKLSRTGTPASNAQFVSSTGECGGNQPCTTDAQNALDNAGGATTYLYGGTYDALNATGNVVLNNNIQFTGDPHFENVTVADGAQVDLGTNTIHATNAIINGTVLHDAPPEDASPNTPVTFTDGLNHPTVILTAGDDPLGSTSLDVTMGQTPPTCGSNIFPQSAVERWFTLSPTNDDVTNGATVRFYYDTAELNGLDPSHLVIWHCNGTNWEQLGGTPGSDANGNYVEISDVTHFSPFGVGNAAPTSATLTSFQAAATDASNVHVTWETGSELNVVGFNVQRKTDNSDFANVNAAVVPAQNLGSINGAQYAYDDTTVSAGANYTYRLQVLLANGSSITSDPVAVQVLATDCATQAPTILAPNKGDAVKLKVKFDWSDASCATKYQIIVRRGDKKGTPVIREKSLTASEFAKKLEAGKYVWRVRAFNGTTWTPWTKWTSFLVQTK